MIVKNRMYGGEIFLNFDDLTHRYTIEGRRIPSVTTILSATEPKNALLFWAANLASDYWREKIKPGESYDELQIESFWKEAKRAHTVKKENAASVGTVVHHFVEGFIKGESQDMPFNDIARGGAERFMSWVNEHKVKFLSAEQPVYSKKYDYCGTADFFCLMDGKLWLGDLKTSNAIYDTYNEQCAAYIQARKEEFNEDFAGFVIVRVGKEDGELEIRKVENYSPFFNVFEKRVSLYHALEETKSLYQKQ